MTKTPVPANQKAFATAFKLCCLFTLVVFFQCCSNSNNQVEAEKKLSLQFYSKDDFKTVEKYDVHVHVDTDKDAFLKQAEEDNFKLITINWDDVNDPPPMEVQQKFALRQIKAFPGRIAYATTFSIRNFNDENWQQQTIAYLKKSFDSGAIAVKIYKVIGMSLRDKNGKLVMIDDPRFDPVIDFIVKNNIPVVGHLGEPKNCWLPIDKMTIKGDQSYFRENPKYYMYLHPEFPSYEDQVRARDHMLEKHSDLKFIGAHSIATNEQVLPMVGYLKNPRLAPPTGGHYLFKD